MEMKIAQLDRNATDGLVVTAHWTVSKTEGEHTASAYGSIGLPEKDADDASFVAFDDLTEAQVVEWVKDAMGEEQVTSLEARLDSQLEELVTPKVVSGTPW